MTKVQLTHVYTSLICLCSSLAYPALELQMSCKISCCCLCKKSNSFVFIIFVSVFPLDAAAIAAEDEDDHDDHVEDADKVSNTLNPDILVTFVVISGTELSAPVVTAVAMENPCLLSKSTFYTTSFTTRNAAAASFSTKSIQDYTPAYRTHPKTNLPPMNKPHYV